MIEQELPPPPITPLHTPKRTPSSFVTATAQLITLLLTLFACIAALYSISIAKENEKTIYRITDNLGKKITQQADLNVQLASLNEAHASLQNQILHLTRKIETQQPSAAYNIWISEQARYYLELATLETKWGGDASTCILLLEQAQKLLQTIQSSTIAPVIQTIKETISQLASLPKPDSLSILNQINQLEDVLNKILHPEERAISDKEQPLDPNTAHSLKRSISHLKRLISIKQHPSTKTAEASIQYTIFIDRIGLNLLEAKLAFLRKNENLYQLALIRAITQAKMLAPSAEQKTILTALEALHNIKVFVPIPSLDAPLKALKEWISAQPNSTTQEEK